jgi:gliding motility-associated-like protein
LPVTVTTGGLFTVVPSTGLALDANTGLIDLSASNLGRYAVKYAFSGLCPSEQSFNITITDAPDAKFSYLTPFCSVGSNPLPVFIPGSSAGRFYSNNPSLRFVNDRTGEIDLSQSLSGNYRIYNEIIAAGGCAPDLDSFDISIIQAPSLANAGTGFSICNNSAQLSANTPVTGTGVWTQISGTPATISDVNNPSATVSGIALGNNVFRWTINGTAPCLPSFSDITIAAINGPIVTSPSTAVTCSGDNLSIALTSDFGTDFIWQAIDNSATTGESITQVQSNTINDAITVISGNTELVVYNVIPFAGNCIGNASPVTVTVNPRPVLDALTPVELCSNQPLTVVLSANSPSTYRWTAIDNPKTTGESVGLNVGSSIGDVIINPTLTAQTVNYQITPVGIAGCSGQPGSLAVKVNPLPQIVNPGSVSICSERRLNVNLITTIPSAIGWQASSNSLVTGESTTSISGALINDSLTNLSRISQQVVYTIKPVSLSGGCIGPDFNLPVDLKAKDDPAFLYPLSLLCKSGNDMLPSVTGLSGGGFTSVPAGLQLNPITGMISPANSLNNDYIVTYNTNGNCPASSSQPIKITDAPKADFSYPDNGLFCSSSNLIYLPILGTGATSGIYVLTPAGINVKPQTGEIDLSNNTPGTYVITNIVPATPGCPLVSFNDTITIIPQPNQANAGNPQTVCGSEVVLSANAAQNGTGNWALVSGSGNISNPLSPSSSVSGLSAGSNVFRWTIAGIAPCGSTNSQVTVVSIPKPFITGQKYKAICSGDEANLQLSANVISTFSWKAVDNKNTIGESLISRSGDVINDRVTNLASDGQLVTYQVTPTSINGNCQGDPSEVMVGVMPVVKVNAGGDSTAILGKPHQLNATGAYRYLWSPVSVLDNPFIPNPKAVINQDTRFIVEGTDELGCKGYDTVFLKVYKGPTYYIPNAFSPNGDGLNDIFRPIPVGIEYTEFFRVYNRWGKLIHESNDFLKGWSGSYNGVKQPIGAYIWVIRGKSVSGEFIDMKGTVILVH